ncbi:zinc finger BED domain-containing protein RICESLEEPER 2-like [Papaver somniferum]|uniref:zinc finger BED domain-containing protein RICESLEEPER 2-like n=1 Tax=Papaver somniferum TaxID=3469 RepID=UPI000E700FA3|nr:zinc finger BED domain-containing protein RICESLEEPER 2-like [Papaver somniferum]
MRGCSSTPTASISSNKPAPRPPPNASSDGGANSAGGASAAGDASADGDATEVGIKVTKTHNNKSKTPEDATEDDTEVTEPKGKKRSDVWNNFDMEPKPSKYAKCRHCKTKIASQGAKYGTGGMNNHLKICKQKPKEEKGQQTLDFQPARLGEEGKLVAVTFNQDACTHAVILFVILDEQPFRVVEGEGFKELCRVLESRFKIPSRMTISRGVLNLYEAEKEKMKNYFKANNVIQVREDGHLKEQVISSNGVLNTKFMQVRYAARVLALVMNAGLGEYHMAIKRVRAVVKHVMSSPARLSKFMDCAKQEKIDCRKGLVLDVDTRWNSTYMMLEAACRYQKSFERLAREDKAFKKKFCFNERSIPPVFLGSLATSKFIRIDIDDEEEEDSTLLS